MGVSIGSRWFNKQHQMVSVVILSEDDYGELWVEVSNSLSDSQYKGRIDKISLLDRYYPDYEFTVDKILTKYHEEDKTP